MISPLYLRNKMLKLSKIYIDRPHYQLSTSEKNEIEDFIWSEYKKLDIDIKYVNYQPYSNSKEIKKDLIQGFIRVTTLHNNSSILTFDGNLRFRALHDFHHSSLNLGFNFPGEYLAFQYIAKLSNSFFIRQILFSEIVLQVSTFYYIGRSYPKDEKIILMDDIEFYNEKELKYFSDNFSSISKYFDCDEKKEYWQDLEK